MHELLYLTIKYYFIRLRKRRRTHYSTAFPGLLKRKRSQEIPMKEGKKTKPYERFCVFIYECISKETLNWFHDNHAGQRFGDVNFFFLWFLTVIYMYGFQNEKRSLRNVDLKRKFFQRRTHGCRSTSFQKQIPYRNDKNTIVVFFIIFSFFVSQCQAELVQCNVSTMFYFSAKKF